MQVVDEHPLASCSSISRPPVNRPTVSHAASSAGDATIDLSLDDPLTGTSRGSSSLQSAVDVFLQRFVPARPGVIVEDLECSIEAVCSLADAGHWRACLQLCARSIPVSTSDVCLQLQTCQVLALVRLKLYAEAQRRMDALGDLDNDIYFFESHGDAYPGQVGSMVPFTLRLLWAELPGLVAPETEGAHEQTISRLHDLYAMASKVLESHGPCNSPASDQYSCLSTLDAVTNMDDTTDAWTERRIRAALALVGRYIVKQNFAAAVQILKKELDDSGSRSAILAADLCRVALQMGNVPLAITAANQIAHLVSDPAESALVHQHWGLIHLSESQDAEAIAAFELVMQLAPHGSLRIAAAVNLATCIVHQGKLRRAIEVAEQVIREDPLSNLDMALCHNLCMMYDLENDQTSAAKKAVIVQLVKQYAADDFDSFSLL